MRKHRFFFQGSISIGAKLELATDISHYINNVLRLQNDNIVFLFNNTGSEFKSKIINISKKSVSVIILEHTEQNTESNLKIILAQTLAKGQKMDYIIQKATELGVSEIVPLYSLRSIIKKVEDRIDNKLSHWQKIAISACGQSGRNIIPKINEPLELGKWLQEHQNQHKLILTPNKNSFRLKNLNIDNSVTILIGPEGGFDASEIQLAETSNFIPVSMGDRILRTETAGVAAIAILQALYGDL